MPGINGTATTFTLPNYVGALYTVSPTDTPFLSAIGGLSGGGVPVNSVDFAWQTYDLRPPAVRARLEGDDAPTPEERTRVGVSNTVQIHHETASLSYTLEAVRARVPEAEAELDWQINQALKQVALDIEHSFITGIYARPADNQSARRTRGILDAIETNVSTGGGTVRDLTEDIVLDLLQDAWDSGGVQDDGTRTLMVNASLKRALTKIFVTDAGYAEGERSIGGVSVKSIETDFGAVNVMLNRCMPEDTLAVVSLEVCKPRLLLIPGKGVLFAEPLDTRGSATEVQLYGEVGLEYGHEARHAKATELKAATSA